MKKGDDCFCSSFYRRLYRAGKWDTAIPSPLTGTGVHVPPRLPVVVVGHPHLSALPAESPAMIACGRDRDGPTLSSTLFWETIHAWHSVQCYGSTTSCGCGCVGECGWVIVWVGGMGWVDEVGGCVSVCV